MKSADAISGSGVIVNNSYARFVFISGNSLYTASNACRYGADTIGGIGLYEAKVFGSMQ